MTRRPHHQTTSFNISVTITLRWQWHGNVIVIGINHPFNDVHLT
jgi:hypothetical protein